MGKIMVIEKTVYSDREPTPDETAAGVTYARGGVLAAPDLADKAIQDERIRQGLKRDQGNISITVLPGERLGELTVNVQFEGKSGERDLCIGQQDALMQEAGDWLESILGGFGCDFRASIRALPCPKAEARLHVDLAAKRLQGVKVSVGTVAVSRIAVGPSVEIKVE